MTTNLTVKDLVLLHKKMVDEHTLPSCITCDYWITKPAPFCNRYRARPPDETIVTGCESWDCDIPF